MRRERLRGTVTKWKRSELAFAARLGIGGCLLVVLVCNLVTVTLARSFENRLLR